MLSHIEIIKLFNVIRERRNVEQPSVSMTISGDDLTVKAVYKCQCGCGDTDVVQKIESVEGLMKLYPDFFGGRHAV